MEKIKLLVVDDIAPTRKDIVRLLYFEDDMIVVGEAVDGMDALKKMGELQPDVVLMDINMPQMDGIAAAERACHLYPHIAVVIISIQGESEYLKKAMVAGARDYMVKPLGSDEMANTIRSVYKQLRTRMQGTSLEATVVAKQSDTRYSEPQLQVQADSYQQYDNSSNLNPTSRAPERPTTQGDYFSGLTQHPQAFPHKHRASQEEYGRPEQSQAEVSLQERVQAIYHQQETAAPESKKPEPMVSPVNQYDAGPYGKQREPHRNEHDFQPILPVPPHYYTEVPVPPVQEPRQQTEYQKQQLFSGVPQAGYDQEMPQNPHVSTPQQVNAPEIQQPAYPYRDSEKPSEPIKAEHQDEKKQPNSPEQLRAQIKQGQDEGAVQQAESNESRPAVHREKKESNVAGNEHQPLGLVTVVFCGKGGVGKTTIATNLAVVLAQQEKKKVALVDFDLQFGDISVLLNLSDGQNISDLVQDSDEITEELLENYMIRHFTGIDILPAPLFPQDAEYILAEHTDKILQLLKKSYDYVIVDTAGTFNEINLMAMDLADQILLVTTRDIVTIKNTKTSLNILDSLDYREKIRVVLNRADHDLGVEIADLEKGLEITVSHQVASDEKAVIASINKGVPVVVSFVNSELSKSFKRLCDRMINGNRHTNKAKLNKSIITRMFSL